jgi:hypothetical protein
VARSGAGELIQPTLGKNAARRGEARRGEAEGRWAVAGPFSSPVFPLLPPAALRRSRSLSSVDD